MFPEWNAINKKQITIGAGRPLVKFYRELL